MIEEVLKNIQKTENCQILNKDNYPEIESINNYQYVIEVATEISLGGKLIEPILYVAMPENCLTQLPKIYVNSETFEKLGYIPHLNKDLSFCIYDDEVDFFKNKNSLPFLIEEMIHKAKSIIGQVEDSNLMKNEFEREFKAYWEISYNNDIVGEVGLSLISNPNDIFAFKINSSFGLYKYLLYNNSKNSDGFLNYLKSRKIGIEKIECFEVEYSNILPPFNMSFLDSVKFIKPEDNKRFRTTINRNGLDSVLVYFKNTKNEFYGWVYKKLVPPSKFLKGRVIKESNWEILNDEFYNKSLVERISFADINPTRLQTRTSGVINNSKNEVCIVGLGSVGSNLLNYLIKLPILKFTLVDSDILKIENIYRYQYGMSYIGCSKVDIGKFNIQNKNPFCEVDIFKDSIEDVIKKQPDIFSRSEISFIVLGRTKHELNIMEYLIKTGSDKPIIIMWVEPYLASGQMIYIKPNDFKKAIELIKHFEFHILDENPTKLILKEGSCQTGFSPYSETYLTMFLSSIFKNIYELINAINSEKSIVVSWVGDKDFLSSKNLKLTEFGNNHNSFELITNEI